MSLLLRNLPERDVPSAGAVDELLAEDAVPPADVVAQRPAPVDEDTNNIHMEMNSSYYSVSVSNRSAPFISKSSLTQDFR